MLFLNILPGTIFSEKAYNFIRMSYAQCSDSQIIEGKIFGKVKEKYMILINWAVTHRMKTILIPIALFIFTMTVGVRFLRIEFMPKQDQGRYSIVAELGKGVDIRKAEEISAQIENIVKKDESTQLYFSMLTNDTVSVNVEIGKKDTRDISVFEVINKIRPQVQKIPGVRVNLSESFQMRSPQRAVEFEILGPNLDKLNSKMKPKQLTVQDIATVIESWTKIQIGRASCRERV